MPDINFLPPEEKSKIKAAKKEERPIEFFRPAADSRPPKIALNAPPAKKKAGGFLKFFWGKGAASGQPHVAETAAVGHNMFGRQNDNFNMRQTRERLLKEIRKSGVETKQKVSRPTPAAEKTKETGESRQAVFRTEKPKSPLVSGAPRLPQVKRRWLQQLLNRLKIWAQPRPAKSQPSQAAANPLIIPKGSKEGTAAASTNIIQPSVSMPQPPEEPLRERLSPFPKEREDILETNLIKDQKLIFFNWRRAIKINIISAAGSFIFIGLVWGYLFWLETRTAPVIEINSQLAAKERELKQLEGEIGELKNLRVKAAEIKKILDQHVYWTNFFSWLENNTLSGAHYAFFAGDISGQYVLPAVASDFKTFSSQIKILQADKNQVVSADASQVAATKAGSGGQATMSFDLNLAVKPDIFKRP